MAIKDPPDYVAIDPCLIYGDTDLPPETHLRLLQLVGWMWVTKRSGKPLGVKIEELAERWGISQRTAYHTLQSLGAQGYLNIHYSRGWTYLERGPMITGEQPQAARGDEHTPGEPAHTGRERRQPNRPREAANTRRESRQRTIYIILVQRHCTKRAKTPHLVQRHCTRLILVLLMVLILQILPLNITNRQILLMPPCNRLAPRLGSGRMWPWNWPGTPG